ncbi:LysM peptidoglycan-binding domain-containing protein [Zooshikella marina]|uniref:lytic transglycosylase n=1 Tax=Zooshikella ganghwensis TaxID=202772 RepID=UPI001BAE6627|nr:LysM peptidoglycan-binding domain-containing protein [Zooshikella ganghwensis]MBU2705344.1 LysM peptidoglycan-binding domain-containing protein [Zooshikella ganghwensis]
MMLYYQNDSFGGKKAYRRILCCLGLTGTVLLTGCQTSKPLTASSQAPEPDPPQSVFSWFHQEPATQSLSAEAAARADQETLQQTDTTSSNTVQFNNVWQRISQQFSLPYSVDNPRMQREIAWFKRNPRYIQRVSERAEPYLFYIAELIEQRGLPTELALLPVIESAYDPFAYSPGRASGLWQFIPSTGKYFGLKQNWWYDGRRDVVASTNAALDYLSKLYTHLGDWELALASYNAGEGTILKAIRRNKASGKAQDYWSLDLPRETEQYVPRLLALAHVIANTERYGIQMPTVANKPYFQKIKTQGQIDLALAADMATLPLDRLYQLNPGFNQWATDPNGPHYLLVPISQAKQFQNALQTLPPNKRMKWQRYQVKRGDSLIAIAHRFQTRTKVIQQANKLASHRIRTGQTLLIPQASQLLSQYTKTRTQRRLGKQARVAAQGKSVYYKVKRGDSFWHIARQYDVSVKSLSKWNNLSPRDTLKPGQRLVIKLASAKSSTHASRDKRKVRRKVNYKVRQGDSLYRIATRFNVRVDDIQDWNQLPHTNLKPGQALTLFVNVTGT